MFIGGNKFVPSLSSLFVCVVLRAAAFLLAYEAPTSQGLRIGAMCVIGSPASGLSLAASVGFTPAVVASVCEVRLEVLLLLLSLSLIRRD